MTTAAILLHMQMILIAFTPAEPNNSDVARHLPWTGQIVSHDF
jgi:hypothetical protein